MGPTEGNLRVWTGIQFQHCKILGNLQLWKSLQKCIGCSSLQLAPQPYGQTRVEIWGLLPRVLDSHREMSPYTFIDPDHLGLWKVQVGSSISTLPNSRSSSVARISPHLFHRLEVSQGMQLLDRSDTEGKAS